MVNKYSEARATWPILQGIELLSRGKVRDTYKLTDDLLLVVATDAISIFDFILNARVPQKGIILTAMNHFWLTFLADLGFKTHFVAAGSEIDQYLPEILKNNPDLQSRAMVVKKLEMAPFEFIFRICLTGSGLKAYKKTGEVCGYKLAPGLQDGDELPCILDTPTDKAEEGHDEHVSAAVVRAKYPEAIHQMLRMVQIAMHYAESRGIKLADTKFEGSADTLGDEVLTPDSSRFWNLNEWRQSRKAAEGRKSPMSLDKELVRTWGKTLGINDLDPTKQDDIGKVHGMVVPANIIAQTTATYRYIFWRLTGMTIEQYLRKVMKVQISDPEPKNITVLFGSDTDIPQVREVLKLLGPIQKFFTHVMSCHRNPLEVMEFCRDLKDTDVVVCIGGKAFALPGVIDAWCHFYGKDIRVAGVALGKTGGNDLLAAQLSITEIPGQPVIFDELTEQAYTGPQGLNELLLRIFEGELSPPKPRKAKPVQMNVAP